MVTVGIAASAGFGLLKVPFVQQKVAIQCFNLQAPEFSFKF